MNGESQDPTWRCTTPEKSDRPTKGFNRDYLSQIHIVPNPIILKCETLSPSILAIPYQNISMSKFLPLLENASLPSGSGPSQPDIAYQPDAEKYTSRTKRRLKNEKFQRNS